MITMPRVSALFAFVGGMLATPDAYAQALSQPTPPGMDWLAPYMPVIISAIMAGGTLIGGWLLKTVFGVSIEAFCTFGETWADEKLKAALKTADPSDDVPAMAFTKAVKAVCAKLRAAEKTLPVGKE